MVFWWAKYKTFENIHMFELISMQIFLFFFHCCPVKIADYFAKLAMTGYSWHFKGDGLVGGAVAKQISTFI